MSTSRIALILCAFMLVGAAKRRPVAERQPMVKTKPAPKDPAPAPKEPASQPTRQTTVAMVVLASARAVASSACDSCHTSGRWTEVNIAHERTGFALRGEHRDVPCRDCHATSVKDPLPVECSGCHRDVHNATLGYNCQSCHDEHSWKSIMSADAHRTGLFPLVGAHAAVPCEECHQQTRDRAFSRVALDCRECHADAYQRAATTSIDHAAAGFSEDCRQCHSVFRFTPARFPAHAQCFNVASGPHAAVACRACHSSLVGARANGQCLTQTAACSSCHTHACDRMDSRHASVPGYQCQDRKCYECHDARGALP